MACSTEENPPPVQQDSGPRPDTQITPDTGADAVVAAPDDAVHVSPTGVDGDNCGTKESPCQTITQGVARASIYQPQRPVAVTGGIFSETVRLASGVHLLGGFNGNFVKDGTGNTQTIIRGVATTGEAVGLIAEDLNMETRVDSVEIEAPQPTEAGKSSYGVVVRNAPLFKLRNCVVRAANGIAGTNGASYTTTAPSGQPGQPGLAGENYPFVGIPPWPIPPPLITDEPDACALVERHPGGLGGAAVSQNNVQCIGAGGTGGASGIDICAGYGGTSAAVGDAVSVCSAVTSGLGGTGGPGGEINPDTCATISQGARGRDGCAGKDGTSGAQGAAGVGRVVGSYWAPTNGEAGSSGLNDATGGGGGGGGGGGECSLKCIPSPGCASDFGGTGGGGGSAGCFGRGGEGGSSAGGSFGVLIADGSSHIEIANCTIMTGRGGAGGNGGSGQPGGTGGNGGAGGVLFQQGGAGGVGGRGGNGGGGGSGGGGAGGPSVGIYVASGASPSLADNTFTLGEGGPGGMAGHPNGNHGQVGLKQEVVTP